MPASTGPVSGAASYIGWYTPDAARQTMSTALYPTYKETVCVVLVQRIQIRKAAVCRRKTNISIGDEYASSILPSSNYTLYRTTHYLSIFNNFMTEKGH